VHLVPLSAVRPVPLWAVLPPLWSLTQEPRPLRPAPLLSRLPHPLSAVAAPPVEPAQAEVLPVVAPREEVLPVVARAAQERAVPAEMRARSVAVPRRPVAPEVELPPVAVRQAALRQAPVVALPWVGVPRLVVALP
jgi:hypothetical protein